MAETPIQESERLARALASLQIARQRAGVGDQRYARLNAEQTLLCLSPIKKGLNFSERYRREAFEIIKSSLQKSAQTKE